ncbi:DUF5977 domain-containing protein [Pontibacter beigongshangensis]|uniref:DUF5977 domain-containing protein n=1 Tax=Pontibacter beigongshangensis TaxID=2574733 RepID=UPI001650381C|nr:DUF5977 domain-containing protein [Pontibacter beigongshangensis]
MNLMAFPFFDSLQEMQRACQHGRLLLSPVTRFLPFQIVKAHDGQPIDCINVFREDGTLYRTIMGNEIDYDYHQTAQHDFITYYGATLAQPLACGNYYLEIQGRYSALFSALNSVSDLLKVEYRNEANLTDSTGKPLAIYQTGFLQRLHLEAEILNPTYPYTEDGNENEYKEFLASFKRVTKQSEFNTLDIPPYLADALGALPMHSQVQIGEQQEVKEIEVSPEWLPLGIAATVNVKFSEANPIIAMGCAETLPLEEYNLANYTPRGFVCGKPDNLASWQNTGVTSCEKAGGQNTGFVLVQQRDMNPASPTYNNTRTVRGIQDLTACPVPVTYYNVEQSEYVQRNNCGNGFTGTEVLVKVAAGQYTSTTSQLDANNKALAHLNSIKQAEANSRGTCIQNPIYDYAISVSQGYSTPSQACYHTGDLVPAYSLNGAFEVGVTLYYDNLGNSTLGAFNYSLGDGRRMSVGAGGVVQSIGVCQGSGPINPDLG